MPVHPARVTACRTEARSLLPTPPALPRRLFSACRSGMSKVPLAGVALTSARFIALLGKPGTDRLIGTTMLSTVQRHYRASASEQRFEAMIEPWATLISTVQPEFLKIGFFKIHEDLCSMTFSDGSNKVELGLIQSNDHPSMVALYTNRNGAYHRVSSLIEKLSSPTTRKENFEAHCALMEKYGMWDDTTPVATLQAGHQASLALTLKQIITFLATHKTTLAKIKPDEESREYAAVRPKASEKVEQERRIFQRLWLSRHDR